jgi:hypothetical protein
MLPPFAEVDLRADLDLPVFGRALEVHDHDLEAELADTRLAGGGRCRERRRPGPSGWKASGVNLAAFIACSFLLQSFSAFGERAGGATRNDAPPGFRKNPRRKPAVGGSGTGAAFLAAQEGQPQPRQISASSAGIGALFR